MSRLLPFVSTLVILTGVVLCSDPRAVTLHSRQGLNIPPECQSTCAPITPALQSRNCSKEQCCTVTFDNGLRDCFLCIGTVNGTQDYTEPQQVLDMFVSSCAAQGAPIPRLTLPGQDNGRSSSSFNPSTLQSSTGSPTQSTTPSTPTQSPSSQTTNNSRVPERWDINMKGLGVIVLGALARVAGVF
ncbi:hypothetical protein E1B28_004754 [Marasmius oreades]|uniref:Uncharacterized protein n=1 Tax=Marasmius oreades TaxID=181124 RepID=A0A9P7UZ93_9AGAR|nr:uncharacterized protein E1B28_004754 [Marasmius oreades]KAG7097404.1 hypothetical protein E1B28_004754 [Marasmius oreades]